MHLYTSVIYINNHINKQTDTSTIYFAGTVNKATGNTHSLFLYQVKIKINV